MAEEKIITGKQKVIVDKIVDHLNSQGSDMYYESTINICREIHHVIQKESFLNHEEKEIVGQLTPHDIQNLLSYNSSCC